ncbi:hypothetical protein [Lysinibacillus sp. G4S2]|uniref:hypothetical protein n=1 Tax=Lysinibacillus sp. G4S2 TaxID=3055859 RepID=UPI0025A2B446|nr:hypothetical protein [Lysinibacillus sp. G4S2]MDM5245727.1 hypothetical protein [Lysinibacillus sp. G4S2]
MTKFNVGDELTFLNNTSSFFTKGKKYKVIKIDKTMYSFIDDKGNKHHWDFDKAHKAFGENSSKKQRITALENEVAELKLIVHELRGKKSIEPSTINTVEDIIEFEGKQYRKVDREAREGDVVVFDKTVNFKGDEIVTKGQLYKAKIGVLGELAFVDNEGTPLNVYDGGITKFIPENVSVYELIEAKPLTPNQKRAVIIEKAKKFVEDNKTEITGEALYGKYKGKVQTWRSIYVFANKSGKHACNVEFVVDAEKRTITALMRGVDTNNLYEEATAKCNPNDVFNEHIGKAIALGRALGLDVSEFEQAVQPNEIAVGHKIEGKYKDFFDITSISETRFETNPGIGFHKWRFDEGELKIINDTNTKYGGVE